MGLTVYLKGAKARDRVCVCPFCKDRHTHSVDETIFYKASITHNLARMASEAGIHDIIWRPDENCIDTASQLINPLRGAIEIMKENPERFKKFDASNGWGTYRIFVPWLEKYLQACKTYPHAKVEASR